jgi:hypothetical protein
LDPEGAVKVRLVGETLTFPPVPPDVVTTNETPTVWITPLALKEMVALYVPACKPDGLTETARFEGVTPESGLTLNQPEPLE